VALRRLFLRHGSPNPPHPTPIPKVQTSGSMSTSGASGGFESSRLLLLPTTMPTATSCSVSTLRRATSSFWCGWATTTEVWTGTAMRSKIDALILSSEGGTR
jgi:hypothetical protein